jgi:hypothetical protein
MNLAPDLELLYLIVQHSIISSLQIARIFTCELYSPWLLSFLALD